MPDDSLLILVFWCQRSVRKSNSVTPMGATNKGRVGLDRRFRPLTCYISKTVQDMDIVTMEC